MLAPTMPTSRGRFDLRRFARAIDDRRPFGFFFERGSEGAPETIGPAVFEDIETISPRASWAPPNAPSPGHLIN